MLSRKGTITHDTTYSANALYKSVLKIITVFVRNHKNDFVLIILLSLLSLYFIPTQLYNNKAIQIRLIKCRDHSTRAAMNEYSKDAKKNHAMIVVLG